MCIRVAGSVKQLSRADTEKKPSLAKYRPVRKERREKPMPMKPKSASGERLNDRLVVMITTSQKTAYADFCEKNRYNQSERIRDMLDRDMANDGRTE